MAWMPSVVKWQALLDRHLRLQVQTVSQQAPPRHLRPGQTWDGLASHSSFKAAYNSLHRLWFSMSLTIGTYTVLYYIVILIYCGCDQFLQWQSPSLPEKLRTTQTILQYNIYWVTFLLELFLCSSSLCSPSSLSSLHLALYNEQNFSGNIWDEPMVRTFNMAHMFKLVTLHSPTPNFLWKIFTLCKSAITYRFNMPLFSKILQIVRSRKITSMRKMN